MIRVSTCTDRAKVPLSGLLCGALDMNFDLNTTILGLAALLFVVALFALPVWAFKSVFGDPGRGAREKGARNGSAWSRRPQWTPSASSASFGATMSSICSLSAVRSTWWSRRESKAARTSIPRMVMCHRQNRAAACPKICPNRGFTTIICIDCCKLATAGFA